MKKYFLFLLLFTGLFAVSCGSGYQVASSRYDDATYFRPDVTARVHMLATASEAEALISETMAQAAQEGTRVETVYTDPQGVANIDVEPGTTYLVMNPQDDSYERKLEMFSDEPDDSFSLTINMSFDYSNWWDYPFCDYSWYGGWNRYRYWYMPMSYWDSWYWYPRTWYRDFWYNDWFYNYWYYPSWYRIWSYSGIWGIYPYDHHYYNRYRDHRDDRNYRDENRNSRRQDLIRSRPGSLSSGSIRSGGSYTRTNPKIEQVSGNRAQRTRDNIENPVDNKTDIKSESGTTNYRRVTGTTGSSAVYRDPASTTRASSGGTRNEFYRRSSNLSRENTRSESSSATTNPGNSRSFYRGTQRPSATVNSGSTGTSGSVRSSSGSTSVSRSSSSDTRSSRTGSSISSGSSRSSSMGSSVSSGSSSRSSSSSGSSSGTSRSGSGGSYRR